MGGQSGEGQKEHNTFEIGRSDCLVGRGKALRRSSDCRVPYALQFRAEVGDSASDRGRAVRLPEKNNSKKPRPYWSPEGWEEK